MKLVWPLPCNSYSLGAKGDAASTPPRRVSCSRSSIIAPGW